MTRTVAPSTGGITLAAFLAMVFAIAGNVIAIKVIDRAGDLDPFWAAASRFFFATLIFVLVAAVLRAPMPRGRALGGALLYGLLTFAGFFALIYFGLQRVPAGVAGVILATSPMLTLIFAVLHRQERLRWDSLAGATVVVVGSAVIFSTSASGGVPVLSLLAILGASACAAEGAVIVKAFPAVHPAARNAIGMGVATVVLLALMPTTGESLAMPRETSTWVAQAYLVTLGSVGVFGLYLFILSRWTASAVSYEFVLAPVVGIALAAWLLDEQVTRTFVAGAALVLVGVYLGALRRETAA